MPSAPLSAAARAVVDLQGQPVGRPAPAVPIVLPGRRTLPADSIRPSDRVAMFVDGANMDGACRAANYFVDYRKAREFFVAEGRYYAGFYYIADFTASDRSSSDISTSCRTRGTSSGGVQWR